MAASGPSEDAVLWAASRTVAMHDMVDPDTSTPGRCAHCPPSGDPCTYLGQARDRLAAARATRLGMPRRPVPALGAAWQGRPR